MRRRALRGMERVLVDLGPSMGPDVLVASLRGPIQPDRLQSAVDAVLARHPLLRARLVDGCWVGGDFEPGAVALTIEERPWREAVEAQLHQPVDPCRGPLVRVRWVPHDGGGHLLFAAHHAVVDGHALMQVLHELLSAHEAHTAPIVRHALPASALEHARAPRWWRWIAPWLRRAGLIALRRVPGAAWARAVRSDPRPRTLATFAAGTPLGWRALRRRCTEQGVSVGGAFLAASWFAACRLLVRSGVDPLVGPAGLETAVSLRGRTPDPIPADAVGYFVSGVRPSARVGADTSLWALAGALKRSLDRQVSLQVPALMQLVADGAGAYRQALRRGGVDLRDTAGLASLINVSNVGPYPHPTTVGRLKIDGVFGLNGICEGGAGLVTWLRKVDDRLLYNAVGSSAVIDRPGLQRLQGEVIELLEGGQPPTLGAWLRAS